MLIHGFIVLRETDSTYKLLDAEGRTTGYVVRHVPADGSKLFRGTGGVDHNTLSDAVLPYTEVGWVKLRGVGGDATP